MASVKIKCDDFIASQLKDCTTKTGQPMLSGGQLKVDFELVVPDEYISDTKLKPKDLEKTAAKRILNDFQIQCDKLVFVLVSNLVQFLDDEANGDSKASNNAAGAVKDSNSKLKTAVSNLRTKARQQLVTQIASAGKKISPKQISSIGSCNIKEIKIEKGVFQNDPAPTQSDITPLLKKSNGAKWLYFGIAATGTAGRVVVDLKKKVKTQALKELRAMDDVPDNASFYEGVIRLNATAADIHFVNKILKDKDVKQCFKTSAPKFGSFKITIKQLSNYPSDLKNHN